MRISEDGKIVTGVNTTVDVKPGETERQAKKYFGGDGNPKPLGVPGATPNQAFNLGLTESAPSKQGIKQSEALKVLDNIASRRDNSPFPIKMYNGTTIEVSPAVARRFLTAFYNIEEPAKQQAVRNLMKTINGFKELLAKVESTDQYDDNMIAENWFGEDGWGQRIRNWFSDTNQRAKEYGQSMHDKHGPIVDPNSLRAKINRGLGDPFGYQAANQARARAASQEREPTRIGDIDPNTTGNYAPTKSSEPAASSIDALRARMAQQRKSASAAAADSVDAARTKRQQDFISGMQRSIKAPRRRNQ